MMSWKIFTRRPRSAPMRESGERSFQCILETVHRNLHWYSECDEAERFWADLFIVDVIIDKIGERIR